MASAASSRPAPTSCSSLQRSPTVRRATATFAEGPVRASLFIIEDNIAPANKRGGNVRTAAIPLGGKADSTSNGVDDGAGEAGARLVAIADLTRLGVKRGGHAIRHAEHAGFNDDKAVSRPVA